MADLPRWVDDSSVDSQAMLGAYLSYMHQMHKSLEGRKGMSYQPYWQGSLWTIKHREPDHWLFEVAQNIAPAGMVEKPCTEAGCTRCGVRGGYQFRWFSPYWAREYNDGRREGSWEAPEIPAALSGLDIFYFNTQSVRWWAPVAPAPPPRRRLRDMDD